MAKASVYLDTTVPSAYFDERAPDRRRLTREFWNKRLVDFDGAISALVLLEIRNTPTHHQRAGMEQLVQNFAVLDFDQETDILAQEYIRRGIFPTKYAADANHVAIAVTNGVSYLVSWNFSHLVKVQTRREVNLVNALLGYGAIEIIAPPEL